MAIKKKSTVDPKRRHKFISFRERVDSIKIDPLRRANRQLEIGDKPTESFLHVALQSWREMNSTKCFTDFAREVAPISQSLPQVIYHNGQIFDLLDKAIAEKDKFSLQALLDLLAQFAHDIGPEFKEFLPRSLNTLIAVSLHEDLQAVEWTFNAIAYIFKYLFRYLVGNLPSIFDLILPLLTLERRPYLSRFAAESFSFFLRNAKSANVDMFVDYAFRKLEESKSKFLESSLIIIFAEALKGPDNSLHSKLPKLILRLQEYCTTDKNDKVFYVFLSIVTDVLHHVNNITSAPLYETSYKWMKKQLSQDEVKPELIWMILKEMFMFIGLRKGSRVPDWAATLDLYRILVAKMKNLPKSPVKTKAVWELAKVSQVLLRHAENMDNELATKIVENLFVLDDASCFIPFCDLFTDMQQEGEYARVIWLYLQRYLDRLERIDDYTVLIVLGIMRKWNSEIENADYVAPIKGSNQMRLYLLGEIDQVVSTLQGDSPNYDLFPPALPKLQLLYSLFDPAKETTAQAVGLLSALASGNAVSGKYIVMLYGRTLSLLAKCLRSETKMDTVATYISQAAEIVADFKNDSFFLHGLDEMLLLLKKSKSAQTVKQLLPSFQKINQELELTLRESNPELRRQGLKVMNTIYEIENGSSSEILSLCIIIEETPFEIATARTFQMHIRRIALDFPVVKGERLQANIISYCFGLLKSPFQPVWQEAVTTIEKLTAYEKDRIWDLLYDGITASAHDNDSMDVEFSQAEDAVQDYEFRCTYLQYIDLKATVAIHKVDTSENEIREYNDKNKFVSKLNSDGFRRRCYTVLQAISLIAEAKSDLLIPIFLSAADSVAYRKSVLLDILKLFSTFKNAKKSLNRDGVYDHIVRLLASPDTDVQKLTLECVFVWNNAAINMYKHNLENLLSAQTFKDELNRLLMSNDEGSIITPEHASTVIPLIVHLLYGIAIGHHGNNNGKSRTSFRSTVLAAIGNLPAEYILLFVNLASDGIPKQFMLDFDSTTGFATVYEQLEIGQTELRRFVGFLSMIEDILSALKSHVGLAGDYILQAVLSCIVYANYLLSKDEQGTEVTSVARNIRSSGMKSLEALFANVDNINWEKYRAVIFEYIISPRMHHFKDENTQDVSPIMRIFLIWSRSASLAPLLASDHSIVPQVMETMKFKAAKEPVFLAAIEFMSNLLDLQQSNLEGKTGETILALNKRGLPLFLPCLVSVLSNTRGSDIVPKGVAVLRKSIEVFSIDLVSDSVLLDQYVDVCLTGVTSWGYDSHSINDVFDVLAKLIVSLENDILLQKCYDELSTLLQSVKERHTRASLISIFTSLGQKNAKVQQVAELLVELNAYAKVRMDELDYERRLSTYAKINVDLYQTFAVSQWAPLLHDSVYQLTLNEEIALMKGASSMLKRFIEVTSAMAGTEDSARSRMFSIMETVIIPAIRNGLRNEHEGSRNEYIAILQLLVQHSSAYPKVADLKILLFDDDEEADFFNNIVHIQSHRRQRAILRLGQIAVSHSLGDFNIAHFMLPLIEHFLRNVTEATSGMAEEAISTIGKLSLSLSWNQYQAIVKRYVTNLERNRDNVRFFSRLLNSVSEAIYLRSQKSDELSIKTHYNAKRVHEFLTKEIVPKLRGILRLSDEQSLADRISVTVPLVKFLCGTMPETMESNLANVVLELSQHLKHRLQDIRDSVRKALSRVCTLVGSQQLNLIMRQMQFVLKRGSHKHILSFSVHSLLVAIIEMPKSRHGELDSCMDIVLDICMDDIFGSSGSEKDAEDYHSKTREVKENKSYDSIEILATNVSVGKFADLLSPLRRILGSEHITLKMERKINDMIRRIGNGIAHNDEGTTHEAISFCLAICSETPEKVETGPKQLSNLQTAKQRFMLTKKAQMQKNTAQNIHYLQRFALDVIKNCLRKNRELIEGFELQEFVKSMKPYLASQHEDIQLSSLKLLTTAARFSSLLEQLDTKFLFTFVVGVIQNAQTVTTELCQTGLKLLATLLQKKKYSTADVDSIAFIVEKLHLDFVEPDKQAHSFAFIKAVLLQKIVVPEIYDCMDKIREIMVNSQSKNTREVSKSLFCQFLMEYQQGRGRMNKQMRFLVHNLDYDHATGRESVMEVVFVLLSKSKSDEVVQGLIELFFIPLTMTLVNDESAECKEMALLLFRTMVQKANSDNAGSVLKSCSEWASQSDKPELMDAATQILNILHEFGKDGKS
ncbi:hypothetical protein V1512DRAFT_77837 [Lipomyces arxii]|uniref:uncharacterized protein n=1 Tax=Lipomyces arxii TaxID=56418 RepID=UPI0034CF56D9